MATEKRIVATGHAIVGNTGGPSNTLAPGDYVVFDEDNEAHLEIEREIEAGRESNLAIEQVDPRQEEQQRQQAKEEDEHVTLAEAQRLQEEARKAQIQAGEGIFDPSTQPVHEVLAYLRQADPDEVERVQRLEAATDRNSKQVADFEARNKE